jgi:hypothetical protein
MGFQPFSAAAADVNGDGKIDLISANINGNTLTVLTNNGAGMFTASSSPGVGDGPRSVVATDVNGDGNPDLISANIRDSTLTVLTNKGDGTFAYSDTLGVGSGVRSVLAADVSGDGWLDLISVNAVDNTLTVLTNKKTGTFILSATLPVGATALSVVAADVNGDGRVDLVSSGNMDTDTLTVLTNNGDGTFTISFSTGIATGSQAHYVEAADLDGDGKVDLIISSAIDSNLTVLLNSPAPPFLNIHPAGTGMTILSWSAALPGFALQQNSELSTSNWLNATDSVNTVQGSNQVIVLSIFGNNYFRLFRP